MPECGERCSDKKTVNTINRGRNGIAPYSSQGTVREGILP